MRFTKLLIALALVGSLALSATGKDVRATWTAPTEGSPAVGYELEVYRDGQLADTLDVPDTTAIVDNIEPLVAYTARVRAYDALGRFGPWSEWSDPYTWDEGAPGNCGIPIWSDALKLKE